MANKNNNKNKGENLTNPAKTTSKYDSVVSSVDTESSLLFGRRNFAFLLAGTGLIALGYFLMAGGNMPSPDVWDEDIIYSTRRTLIAPIFILAGLVIQLYTIFGKK